MRDLAAIGGRIDAAAALRPARPRVMLAPGSPGGGMGEDEAGQAQFRRLAERAQAARDDWFRRFALWVAVGNAAALAACGSRLADAGDRGLWLVGPAWCFSIGLICAGALVLTVQSRHDLEAQRFAALGEGRTGDAGRMGHLYRAQGGFQVAVATVAAASFILGLLAPLTGLTLLAFGIRL